MSNQPRDTATGLLADFERRINRLEHKARADYNPASAVIAVATIADLIDPTIPVYAEDTGLVWFGGVSFTWAQWSSVHPPVTPGDPGDIKMGAWVAAPVGWLLLDGSSITNADTKYPKLWAVVPAVWKSGTTLDLPDFANRVPMGGGSLGTAGGANSRTIALANLPAHAHTMAHTHTYHLDRRSSATAGGTSGDLMIANVTGTVADIDLATSAVSTPNTGNAGSGTALDTTPANIRVNWAIKI